MDSRNHILLAGEPAWTTFLSEVTAFLEPDRRDWARGRTGADEVPDEPLSPREEDVLRLCADGLTNDEIAARLGLSPRTVERHLSNVYLKLGLTGSAARAGAVARYLRAH
jgi:DNA-binding NarL/FixJ family response regulator